MAFCHTQIGPFLSKNGQNYVIFGLKWLKMSADQTFYLKYVSKIMRPIVETSVFSLLCYIFKKLFLSWGKTFVSSFLISLISRFYDILWCQKDDFFPQKNFFFFRSNIKWVLVCSPDCPDFKNVYVNGVIFIIRGTAFDFVFHYWKRTGGCVSILIILIILYTIKISWIALWNTLGGTG